MITLAPHLLFAAVVALAVQQGPTGAHAPQPFQMQGQMSGVRMEKRAVIRNARQLKLFWRGFGPQGRAPMPAIDFRKYTLVAWFVGEKPTAGYSAEIGDARVVRGSALIPLHLKMPPRGAMLAQVITSPYSMRALPKLPANVTFEVN